MSVEGAGQSSQKVSAVFASSLKYTCPESSHRLLDCPTLKLLQYGYFPSILLLQHMWLTPSPPYVCVQATYLGTNPYNSLNTTSGYFFSVSWYLPDLFKLMTNLSLVQRNFPPFLKVFFLLYFFQRVYLPKTTIRKIVQHCYILLYRLYFAQEHPTKNCKS